MKIKQPRIHRRPEYPDFCWSRNLTKTALKKLIRAGDLDATALVLREANMNEVWDYTDPYFVQANLENLLPRLGRRKELWKYAIDGWEKLGLL